VGWFVGDGQRAMEHDAKEATAMGRYEELVDPLP